ncbi:MAG: hypothetical protein AB1606_05525 [Nitrospirota bacterium]
MKKFIIFTDLDGTLLDYSTYSFEAVLEPESVIPNLFRDLFRQAYFTPESSLEDPESSPG